MFVFGIALGAVVVLAVIYREKLPAIWEKITTEFSKLKK